MDNGYPVFGGLFFLFSVRRTQISSTCVKAIFPQRKKFRSFAIPLQAGFTLRVHRNWRVLCQEDKYPGTTPTSEVTGGTVEYRKKPTKEG
jgi:hypothetical protein